MTRGLEMQWAAAFLQCQGSHDGQKDIRRQEYFGKQKGEKSIANTEKEVITYDAVRWNVEGTRATL